MRPLLALLLLAVLLSAAHALGLGREGRGFGKLGAMDVKKSAAIPSCSGTGLNFTVACNSQYIGTL